MIVVTDVVVVVVLVEELAVTSERTNHIIT